MAFLTSNDTYWSVVVLFHYLPYSHGVVSHRIGFLTPYRFLVRFPLAFFRAPNSYLRTHAELGWNVLGLAPREVPFGAKIMWPQFFGFWSSLLGCHAPRFLHLQG